MDFFSGFSMPRSWTSTLIVTIPKVDSPTSFSELRPISLCNFSNKVITKLLTTRLTSLLPRIISPQQSGFVRGKLIHENILLAQELMQSIKKKVWGSNLALKLDMAKAYDRMSWFALIKVMRKFGFCEEWLDMIFRCISSCWFSVLVNGESCGFFPSSRGLRQGDPISPYLFIIAAEVLSRGLNQLHMEFPQFRYRPHIHTQMISHLSYADDIIIFCNGAKVSLEAHMRCLNWYQNFSGQLVNTSKSCYITGKPNDDRDGVIGEVTGFQKKCLPLLYLGCPLYVGRKRAALFDPVLRKMENKMASWQGKILSAGAKLTLIKSCLQAIPLYYISLMDPPKGVINSMYKIIANFFWSNEDGNKKCHWVRREKMFDTIQEGGLGLRKFEDMAKAFAMKLWWRFRGTKSLWAEFMLDKYCFEVHPMDAVQTSYASHVWKRMLEVKDLVEDRIGWRLGRGHISIHEKWLDGKMPNIPFEHVEVASLFDNGRPKADFIRANYGDQLLEMIQDQKVSLLDQEDSIIWRPSSSGKFSINSAWRECRVAKNHSRISSNCWHKHIPTKISIFVWRALNNGIPTDDAISRRGILLASRCSCCPNSASESLCHLLLQSSIATQVWGYFMQMAGIRGWYSSLHQFLAMWWFMVPSEASEVVRWLCHLIPLVGCWEIWKARNKHRFEGIPMCGNQIISKVVSQISDISKAFNLSFNFAAFDKHLLDGFRLIGAATRKKVRLIAWQPPLIDEFKLNTDGVSRGNPGIAAGGGIFRDKNGDILYAYAEFYGEASNMVAETKAALEGLRIAWEFGISSVWLEVDSEVLMKILIGEYHIPWSIWYLVQKMKALMKVISVRVTHILREGNKVADCLANEAATAKRSIYYHTVQDLPKVCLGAYHLDKASYPYIRIG